MCSSHKKNVEIHAGKRQRISDLKDLFAVSPTVCLSHQ